MARPDVASLARPKADLVLVEQAEHIEQMPVAEAVERDHRRDEAGIDHAFSFDLAVLANSEEMVFGQQEHVFVELDDHLGGAVQPVADVLRQRDIVGCRTQVAPAFAAAESDAEPLVASLAK